MLRTLKRSYLRMLIHSEYNYYHFRTLREHVTNIKVRQATTLHLVPVVTVLRRGQNLPILYFTRAYKWCVVSFVVEQPEE